MKRTISLLQYMLIVVAVLFLAIVVFDLHNFPCIFREIDGPVFNNFGVFYGGVFGSLFASIAVFYTYKTFVAQRGQVDILTKTLEVQNDQFDVLKKDSDFNILNHLYDNLLGEINSIEYRKRVQGDTGPGVLFKGIDALYNFEAHYDNPNSVLNHLQSILIGFDDLIIMADTKVEYNHENFKDIMLTRIYFLYYEKIIWPVNQKLYEQRVDLINAEHPGAKGLFDKFEELTKKAYTFLIDKGYVEKTNDPGIGEILNS
jgi:hypothetical protein